MPPPPPPSPYAPYAPVGGGGATPTPGLATAALVCGIVGLFLFFLLVVSVVGVVLGLVAASRAKQAPNAKGGLGRARAGWITGAVGIAGFVAMVIGIAVSGGFEDTEVAVNRLEVGDCVDVPDTARPSEVVETLPRRDCDEPHDAEVFLVDEVAIDSEEYPGLETVTAAIERACGPAFERFVGVAYDDSALDIYYLYPIEELWEEQGDRGFVCMIITVDGSQLRGSVEGTRR